MNRADPYRILEIPREATQQDIIDAYRRQLRRHHPDTRASSSDDSASSDAMLREIIDAYAILGDPQRRADYDATHPQPELSKPDRRNPTRRTGTPWLRAGPVRWLPPRR